MCLAAWSQYAEMERKERGGIHQRKAKRQRRELEENEATKSILAYHLVNLVMWGLLSGVRCQQIAQWAVQDGLDHPEIVILAKLGTSGRHKQNVYSELLRRIPLPRITAALTRITIPVKKLFSVSNGFAQKIILLPHLLLAHLYKHHIHHFRNRILGGSESNIEDFWESQSRHPALVGHPMKRNHRLRGNYKRKAVPIALHGDGVATTAVGKSYSKSVEGFSWQSCLMMGRGGVTLTNFLICMIFKNALEGSPETQAEIWLWMCWSLYWAYQGTHPTHGPDGSEYTTGIEADLAGTELAGGYFFVLWAIRGDLEYMMLQLKLRSYSSNTPCNCCDANSTTYPWTDARKGAAWLGAIWSKDTFEKNFPDRHCIFKLPGVSIQNYCPDWLHCKHLGADAWFLGSVLDMLCVYILPGTFDENLKSLKTEMIQLYSELKISERLPTLTKGMFHTTAEKFPCLKGRGSCIKAVGPVLEILFERHMHKVRTDTPAATLLGKKEIRQWVLWALQTSNKLHKVMDSHSKSYALPPDAAASFEEAAFRFCGFISLLGDAIHPHGICLFHYTIKFHYILHIGLAAAYQNPLMGSCMQGEQMMVIIKQLAASCARSNNIHQVTNAAMEKYCRAVGFELLGEDDVVWLRP